MSKETELRVIRHASATLQSLNKCRKEGLLCDVTIIVGEETYLAHRYVLAVSSEYFRNLFSEDKKEEVIRITDTKPEIIKQCIDFIYTGSTDITDENVRPLWKACSNLQLCDIVDRCAEYLLNGMNGKRCLLARELAIEHGHAKLQKAAEEFGQENLNLIYLKDEYLNLTKDELVFFLSPKKNALHPPPIMYNAVVNWIYHDFDVRMVYFPSLLDYIKLNILSSSFLLETVRKEPLFRKFDESGTKLEQELFARLHKTKISSAIILFESGTTVKAYNIKTRRKCHMHTLEPGVIEACTALAVWDYLYVLKGNMTFRLNRGSKIAGWTRMDNMSITRSSRIKATSLDEAVYVTGGRVGPDGVVTSAVEYFDPLDKKWCKTRDMPVGRDGHVFISDDQFLYCIGGITDDGTFLDSVDRFEISSGIWSSMKGKMKMARFEAAGLEFDENLYIFGGKTASGEPTNSVEVYDPEKDVFMVISSMVHRRYDFSVGRMGNTYFVVGGDEKRDTATIETIDIKSRKWEVYDNLSIRGRLESAVVTKI